jgi:hypothetical protein
LSSTLQFQCEAVSNVELARQGAASRDFLGSQTSHLYVASERLPSGG